MAAPTGASAGIGFLVLGTRCRPARKRFTEPRGGQALFWGCYPSPDPLTALCDSLMTREGRPASRWTAALFHSRLI